LINGGSQSFSLWLTELEEGKYILNSLTFFNHYRQGEYIGYLGDLVLMVEAEVALDINIFDFSSIMVAVKNIELYSEGDKFYGNDYNDIIYSGDGADHLLGRGGDDRLFAERGNDRLYMDAGNDTLDGGSGTDWLYVTGSTNSVVNLAKTTAQITGYGTDIITNIENASGGSGVDKFHGTTGNNTLKGNNGNDLLYGRGGNDLLHGGNDNDKLYGDTGADSLIGGTGSDLLYGGADSARDVFIFNSVADSKIGSTRDKVYDFRTKVDDLDLRGIDANTRVSGNQEFSFSTTTAKANSVWYKTANLDGNATTKEIIVYGDVNGDAKADFEIGLMGVTSVIATDFIL
jgi:Ca2+-binding RTX toxin-like protein